MRKVLILAYDFPPYESIGAQRPYSWYNYLKTYGLEPTVVTRHWDVPILNPEDCYLPSRSNSTVKEITEFGTVIRSPFRPTLRDRLVPRNGLILKIIRKALSLLHLGLERKIPTFDNKRKIFIEARNLLMSEKYDLIIATGEPFILFNYASKLSFEFGIPWIADYRDGWSTNYNATGFEKLVNKFWFGPIEKRIVATASLVTVAAPAYVKELSYLLKRETETIQVVYNGYFEDLFEGLENVLEKETFHIVHAGTLYYFQRVETFLQGMNLFLKENPEAEITTTFFGLNFYPAQIERIKAAAGSANVKFTDKIPHKQMLEELASSHLQLLIATPEKHQIYGKVFDYLASGRPTLMVENDKGPLEWILSHQENSFSASTAEEVAKYIKELYSDREKTKRLPRSENQFSRRKQTERFANLILEVLNKNEK